MSPQLAISIHMHSTSARREIPTRDYPESEVTLRSTTEPENYRQLILMYAVKRFSYTPPVYKAHNILTALDYNAHIRRETKEKCRWLKKIPQNLQQKGGR